jgi:hypothetical protein
MIKKLLVSLKAKIMKAKEFVEKRQQETMKILGINL